MISMKVWLYIFIFSLSLVQCQSETEKEVLVGVPKWNNKKVLQGHHPVKDVNLQKFIGKPIYEVLQDTVLRNYQELLLFDEPPGRLSGIMIMFDDRLYVNIHVHPIIHQKAFNEDRKWSLELFLKENVAKIEFHED